MKVFDAHMHLNMKSENIVEDFVHQVKINSLSGFNLILNSEEEKEYFFNNSGNFSKIGVPFAVTQGLNFRSVDEDMFSAESVKSVKLHPRLHNITKNDFIQIKDKLSSYYVDVIVVDAFFNGHHFENHIGIELAVFLAEEFPEAKIIIAHMGGHKALECVLLTKTLYNIYHDISFSMNFFEDTSVALDILFLCKKYNKRIMFGSDYPDYSVREALSCMNRYLDQGDFDETERANLLYKNAMSIYTKQEDSQ